MDVGDDQPLERSLEEPMMVAEELPIDVHVHERPLHEKQVQANVKPPHLVIAIPIHEPE